MNLRNIASLQLLLQRRFSVHTPMLQSVSTAEAGFYKCFSKGLTDPSLTVQGVELVVKKDWEEVWETDTEVCSFTKQISHLLLPHFMVKCTEWSKSINYYRMLGLLLRMEN
jgi:hypothetical protein